MTQAIAQEAISSRFNADCGCSGCSFMLRLEAERFGSFRQPAPQEAPQKTSGSPKTERPKQPSIEQLKARWERDKLFYDAGRFAAGARDEEATTAFAKKTEMGAA